MCVFERKREVVAFIHSFFFLTMSWAVLFYFSFYFLKSPIWNHVRHTAPVCLFSDWLRNNDIDQSWHLKLPNSTKGSFFFTFSHYIDITGGFHVIVLYIFLQLSVCVGLINKVNRKPLKTSTSYQCTCIHVLLVCMCLCMCVSVCVCVRETL